MPPLTRANVCSLARNRIRLHGHGATVAPHASPVLYFRPAACGRCTLVPVAKLPMRETASKGGCATL